MSKRVRMTQRRRQGADESIPYPGNVNQPDRTDPAWEAYHTFEQSINHELPDMRHEWQDNPRDEIGFGIPEAWGMVPTVPAAPREASVRIAANKSVKLAVLLLGEKAPEEVIEAQARDFMGMPGGVMDRTLSRFAGTQKFYAADEDGADSEEAEEEEAEKETDEKSEDKTEEAKKASEELAEGNDDNPTPDAVKEAAEDEDKEVQAMVAKLQSIMAAEDEAEEVACKASDDAEAEETVAKKAAKPARKAQMGELDIELSPAVDTGLEDAMEVDAELEGFLDDEVPVAVEDEIEALAASQKQASKKKGIKSIGAQVRVASSASTGEAPSLENIWTSAPEVSDIFNG